MHDETVKFEANIFSVCTWPKRDENDLL